VRSIAPALLTAQIRFKLGEHAQHVEEGFAGGGPGIDRLFGCLQSDTSGLQLVHNVLKVLQRTCQTVNAGNDERVALAQEIEQDLQLGAAIPTCAAGLLGANHLAAGTLQCLALDRKVLIESRYASIAVNRHR
jgi:hypothetical protein